MANSLQAGQKLSPREYLDLLTQYEVTLRSYFLAPMPPVWYGRVTGKVSEELIGWLWYNPARNEWVIYPPDSAPEECVQAFEI